MTGLLLAVLHTSIRKFMGPGREDGSTEGQNCMSTTDEVDPVVRDHLVMRAENETNAEGIIVEATETGTKVRLLYHPPEKEPLFAPVGRDGRTTVFQVFGYQQRARKFSQAEVADHFGDLTNADHIDRLDFENHYEVQLVYEADDPRW